MRINNYYLYYTTDLIPKQELLQIKHISISNAISPNAGLLSHPITFVDALYKRKEFRSIETGGFDEERIPSIEN